jgi:Uma2 family endonuclease
MALGLFTSADLDRLPDIPGVRYEIIDGELHVTHQPTLGHQYAADETAFALRAWNRQTNAGWVFSVPGLVFAEDQDVVPDVVWISRERLAEAEDDKGHLRLAPELVVEVLSPGPANAFRDRQLKLSLYGRRGVQEYWIVDWMERTVEVYRRAGEELQLAVTLSSDDTLTSPLLPGFTLSISQLWRPSAG